MNGSIEWVDRKVFVALGALLASPIITSSVFSRVRIIWQEVHIFATSPDERGSVLEGALDVSGAFAGDIILGTISIIAGGAVGFVIHAVVFRSARS